jgi:Replication-relaxation
VLRLVSTQRVLTQTQLARLLAEVSERTLRYRTERLFRLGLLGRSRPYRETGSHPFHLWPTRQADAYVRGAPVPRGGERAEPNPLFLAHEAALSEMYVLLATGAAGRPALRAFRREGEAREPFRASGRERALAPDALVELQDGDGGELLAFVELDLGTMSRPRLRTKAAGYVAYVHEQAWARRHPFCPAMLFVTTGETRALAFLKLLASELDRLGRWRRDALECWFAAAACAHVHDLDRAVSERCWDDRNLNSGLALQDCLEQARRPYERALADAEAQRVERERRRDELVRDPAELRRHLRREHRYALPSAFAELGEEHARALNLLLESEGEIEACERAVLLMLARALGEQLLNGDQEAAPPLKERDRDCVEQLALHYRQRQRARVVALARRYGVGPRLRQCHRRLEQGALLDHYTVSQLERDARSDSNSRHTQERLRLAYMQRREHEARQRARAAGLATYLLHGTSVTKEYVDAELLRRCEQCDEIVYPAELEPHSYGYPAAPRQCHFCGSTALSAWEPRYTPVLDAAAAPPADLRPSAIDGFMDDPEALDQEPYR